jgi:hypothetical protein
VSHPPRAIAIPASNSHPSRPLWSASADALAAGLFGGALAASAFALYFLAVDLLRGEALATPSLVGAVVFRGASPLAPVPVDLGIVGGFSLLHGALFVGFATLAAFALARLRALPDLPLLALVLALGLEASFLLGSGLFAPGLGGAIGHGVVLAGNAVAGLVMAVLLRRELAPLS